MQHDAYFIIYIGTSLLVLHPTFASKLEIEFVL